MSARRVYGAFVRRACQSLVESPLPAMAGRLSAPALRRLRFRALQGATLVEAVDSLLGPMPEDEAVAIAGRIAANRWRAACVMKVRKTGGIPELLRMIRWSDDAGLQELHARRLPAILVTWHVGVPQGMSVSLGRLGIPALVFVGGPPLFNHRVPGIELLEGGDPDQRTGSLLKAFAHLRRGGIVGMAIDVTRTDAPVEVPFLGRRVLAARGAASLSRLTGAPMLPIVNTWAANGGFEVRCFEELPTPRADRRSADAFEREATLAAAHWFDQYIRTAPEQLGARDVARLVRAPCWSPPPAAPAAGAAPDRR